MRKKHGVVKGHGHNECTPLDLMAGLCYSKYMKVFVQDDRCMYLGDKEIR